MIYRQRKSIHILSFFFIFLAIFLAISSYIEIPFNIRTYSEVFPKEKWILTRGNGGQVISNFFDYTKGYTAEYKMAQFERGEYVSINFEEFLKGKKKFAKGDTVILIHSSNYIDKLISAKGDLEIALANLKSQTSAEKEPVIREAENKLKYIEERINEQTALFNRTQQLYKKQYATQEEYELLKWSIDLLGIEKKIYTAQIENLKTGVKPEEINLLETQVNTMKARLDFLKELESDLLILSPINGTIINSFSPDTLLIISNNEEVVIHSPIKIHNIHEFVEKEIIPVSFEGIKEKYEGKVLAVGKEVKFLGDQQVVFVSLTINNDENKFLPGMVVQSSFQVKNTTSLDYLISLFVN